MNSNQFANQLKLREKENDYIFGMTIGSGALCQYAKQGGVDFVMTLSAGRFRQMGMNSLASYLPFDNCNNLVMNFSTREVLPNSDKLPVIFCFYANDPQIDMEELFQRVKRHGFVGVCNIPTIAAIDGQYRLALESVGITYQREVDAIRRAHELGLFTIAMASSGEEGSLMAAAGADMICAHFGAASGGLLGAKTEITLKSAIQRAEDVFTASKAVCPDILKTMYGGPAKTPPSINYLMNTTHADGYIGGYAFERLLMETPIQHNTIKKFLISAEPAIEQNADGNFRRDDVEYIKEYIAKNYGDEISLSQFAKTLHVSRTYLSSQFAKKTGFSFTEYLINYRIRKATELLLCTNLSASDIARKTGYDDYAHFSKMFKKATGFGPTSYRKQYKKT